MPATTALLEREPELARIEELLSAARAGCGGLLTIEGEAGAGKTSLLEAAGAVAAEAEMRVLRARGGEYERDFPYGVVRQLFEPVLAEVEPRADERAGSAALAAPIFEPQVSGQGGDPFAIQHGLYWLTADLAACAPTVLLVDDAQWADLASLQALVYIGRRIEGLPALFALTVRSGEPGGHERLLDELRVEPTARRIEPAPLTPAATGALALAEVGRRPSDAFCGACCEAAGGNPFLLVELLRALGAEQVDPEDGNAARLAELAAAGVSRSILTRLAKLGEHAIAVARAVAVLEPNAEARLVAELSGLSTGDVAEATERLVRARLLTDSRPPGFVHPLVREAVLSEVPTPRRAADHARAARLLERDGAAGDTVGSHLLLAEPEGDEWAVSALREAGAKALARGAPGAAVRYLRRALQEPPAKDERQAVSRELGLALLRATDREGIEILRTVRGASEDPIARAELAHEISTSLGLRGGGEEAAALLEESLADVDPASELGTLLRASLLMLMVWGLERMPGGDPLGGAEELDSRRFADRVLLGQMATLHSLGLGTIEDGLQLARRSAPSVETVVEDATKGMPHQGTFTAFLLADRGGEIAGLFEPSLEASSRRGVPLAVAGGHGIRSLARMLDGELAEAGGDSDIAMNILHGVLLTAAAGVWTGGAIRVAAGRGDFAGAEAMLADPWGERPPLTGIPAAIFLCARGELRRATGRYAEARHDYLAASERIAWLPLANQEIFPWRIGLALCEAALGNEERARELSAEAVDAARQAGGARGIGIALRVHGTVSPAPQAIDTLREAEQVLAGTRARLEHARAQVELGAALRRANHRKEARDPLREALETAHRCSAVPLGEQARAELEATGARPRKAVYSGVEALTPSELRVARMGAEGMTNREIAQALTVTEKTIETHMRHVFQKLDIARRTELGGALAAK